MSSTTSGRVRFRRSGSPCDVAWVVAEPVAAVVLVREAATLDRGAVRAVQDEDPFGEQGLEPFPHAETLPAAHGYDQRSSVG